MATWKGLMRGAEDGTKSTDCWTLTVTLYYFTGHKHFFSKGRGGTNTIRIKVFILKKEKAEKDTFKILKVQGLKYPNTSLNEYI